MEINTKIVIPWRRQESREYAFDILVKWYQTNLPEAEIIIADDGRSPFCLSGTRNVGVREAEERGADVVIINDADTIPELEPLKKAIKYAYNNLCVVLPYNRYHSLRVDGTSQFLYGIPLKRCNFFLVDGACSGVYVATPQTWWAHYGQDERFRGWGFEDAAWMVAHNTLLGRAPKRVEGTVYAFHHESADKEGPEYTRNAQLCYTYLQAEGNKEEVQRLASEGLFLDY